MTVGQRIAQKRKELGLSQENLGDRLGVSRQAIYKWESDQTLPEIDKLVNLSKLFSVPVGWLLGVEEESAAADSGELTEQQLTMVQEIADRYIAAIPVPEAPEPTAPPRRRRWPLVLAGLAGAAIVFGFGFLSDRLGDLQSQYANLNSSMMGLQTSVSNQIGSITGQVQSILEQQASLLADWSCEEKETDLSANTITFSLRAVPKTYEDGMTAVFTVVSDGETQDFPVAPGPGHAFTLEADCPLTDDIQFSIALLTPDGRRQTQLLDQWTGLYMGSFPFIHIPFGASIADITGDTLKAEKMEYRIRDASGNFIDLSGALIDPLIDLDGAQVRMGLFKDQVLVTWYETATDTIILNGTPAERSYFQRPETTLEHGPLYQEVVVLTDQYGRERVYAQGGVQYLEATHEWVNVDSADGYSSAPADWKY